MPVTLSAPPAVPTPAVPPRKRWTREECAVLGSVGLVDLDRYELIEGELIGKVGKNHPHSRALALMIEWLMARFVGKVMPECSIDVSPEDNPTSEPEPDAIVLTRPVRELSSKARPGDIRLLVEISDSTLAFDLTTKAGLYARAAIPEYWVLDVGRRRLIAHRDPAGGQYRSIVSYNEDEFVACLAAPDAQVRVGDLI